MGGAPKCRVGREEQEKSSGCFAHGQTSHLKHRWRKAARDWEAVGEVIPESMAVGECTSVRLSVCLTVFIFIPKEKKIKT